MAEYNDIEKKQMQQMKDKRKKDFSEFCDLATELLQVAREKGVNSEDALKIVEMYFRIDENKDRYR